MDPLTLSLAIGGPPPVSSCPLLALPAELILEIAHPLTLKDLSHFMRTCRTLCNTLASPLHSMLAVRKDAVLAAACLQNNTTKLRVAIAAGAKPGTEHLMSACSSKATAIVIVLLDEYAVSPNPIPIDAIWQYQKPVMPLDVATRTFHIETIEALLARGAKPYLTETRWWRYHFDSLLFAMLYARHLLAPFVERGFHLESLRFEPRTALGWAVRFGCVSTVKLLLKHGSDVNERQLANGMSPLHECCTRRGNNIEMMMILLEAGADTGDMNLNFQTPLQVAMCRGDVEAVRLLVKFTGRDVRCPICWFPVRCRDPGSLPGRLECWRITEEAGINTGMYTREEWPKYKEPGEAVLEQQEEESEQVWRHSMM